jgi:cell division protein FtsW (lipid II flippase)
MPVKPTFRLRPYRLLPGVDWMLIGAVLGLLTCGILTLWGAKMNPEAGSAWPPPAYARLQMQWAGVGLVGMLTFALFDYRRLRAAAWVAYGVLLLALVGVLIFGHTVNNAKSWFNLGGIKVQPAEPCKLVVIFVLADYLSRRAPSSSAACARSYRRWPSSACRWD